MKHVTVKKSVLLETIKKNRDKHITDYNDAIKVYIKQFREQAKILYDASLESSPTKFISGIRLPVPVSYIPEYDRSIDMLNMSVDENIELDTQTFNQLVLDEWSWAPAFKSLVASYKGEL